jgi:MFS family permease
MMNARQELDTEATAGPSANTPVRRAPAAFNAVNFFLADVAGGLGPFLPAWLATALHWQPERIGFLMTASGVAGLVCNTPGGALVDRLGRPRLMIGVGSTLILLGIAALVRGHMPRWCS